MANSAELLGNFCSFDNLESANSKHVHANAPGVEPNCRSAAAMLLRCNGMPIVYPVAQGPSLYRSLVGSTCLVASAWSASTPIRCGRIDKQLVKRNRRYASTSAVNDVQNVAILGGGITGLAAAHYITEELPHVKVTIFESKAELGGWLRSKTVDVGDGQVIFESGPRSLRPQPPNGTLALRLIEKLGLADDLLVTSRASPAARNRYIYYPDRLVRMPSTGPGSLWHNLRTVFREPVFAGVIDRLSDTSPFGPRPPVPDDESVGDFVSKRIGERAANNLVSALFHGIYAGDVWQLSAKSVLGLVYEQEKRNKSLISVFYNAAFKQEAWAFADDTDLQMKLGEGDWDENIKEKISDASVFTFKRGIFQLVEALMQRLATKPNVTFAKETQVTNMEKYDKSGSIRISSKPTNSSSNTEQPTDPTTNTFTHVISTLPSSTLPQLISSHNPLPQPTTTALTSTPSVTVCVVNLYFRTPRLLQQLSPPNTALPSPLEGFGYLIPNSCPFNLNPERALGVIFDSDISPSLHTTVPEQHVGTRLTVMLGGHWWDGWSSYPDEDECVAMARLLLARQLGLEEEPVTAQATLQRNCIPQYTVGHSRRMATAHRGLVGAFEGRLKVAGSAFGVAGVGVNDCLRGAWDVVQGMVGKGRANVGMSTGLEKFEMGRPMVRVKRTAYGVDVIEMEDAVKGTGYLTHIK